jgi:hypothetical protein
MPASTIPTPSTAAPRRELWTDARVSAVVEAAYLLEAVRR